MAAPVRTPGLELLRSDVRRRLLDLLGGLTGTPGEDGGPSPRERGMSAAELAEVIGLHVTTVRFHVDQLVRAGLLSAHHDEPVGAGRPRKLYAVPAVAAEPPSDPAARAAYDVLTGILAAAGGAVGADPVGGSPQALHDSGRHWGRDAAAGLSHDLVTDRPATSTGAWLAKVGAVLDLLTGWGHTPEVRTRAGSRHVEIMLHDCPFLDLARQDPQLVCAVHRGLLRGALDGLGEPGARLTVEPLVEDRTCLARIDVPVPFADRGETP